MPDEVQVALIYLAGVVSTAVIGFLGTLFRTWWEKRKLPPTAIEEYRQLVGDLRDELTRLDQRLDREIGARRALEKELEDCKKSMQTMVDKMREDLAETYNRMGKQGGSATG